MSHTIKTLPKTESTNDYLKNHPDLWNADFNCVRALIQTSGRGRYSRKWVSTQDDLTFSFLFRPGNITEPAIITLYAGMALYRILNRICEKHISIKWPNDIYSEESKLAGILTELIFENKTPIMIIGIGLNVNSLSVEYGINRKVTSLTNLTNEKYDLNSLLSDILAEVKLTFKELHFPLTTSFQQEWETACACVGRKIKIQKDGEIRSMTVLGIAKNGSLHCQDGNGNEVDVRDATIVFE